MAIYSLNVLMAGTTGSGKSTILNMMIKNVAEDSDPGYMVLLDPKKLELEEWHHHPRCLWYADTVENCVCLKKYSTMGEIGVALDQLMINTESIEHFGTQREAENLINKLRKIFEENT